MNWYEIDILNSAMDSFELPADITENQDMFQSEIEIFGCDLNRFDSEISQ